MTRQKSASFRIGSLKKTYLIYYQSAFVFSGILYLLAYRLFLRRALMFFLPEKKTNKKYIRQSGLPSFDTINEE
jgi:hypothetical protein